MTSGAAERRLVVGIQPVREAVRVHGNGVSELWVSGRGGERGTRLDALARFARDQGVGRVERVSDQQLDRLAGRSSHQGVAAWAPALALTAPETLLAAPALLAVALDGIQDPQNFGAVIRSAVAIAGAAVVWGEHASAPLTPATFRASAGAVEHARLCRTPSLHGLLREAAASDVQVVGLDASAPAMLSSMELTGATILVIGGEQSGLHRGVRRACSALARITMAGGIDSLNASAAAAVALYEAARQRAISST